MEEVNSRVVFVDYIRVVACFLVMLVHASENFYAADASGIIGNFSMLATESNRFWVSFYDGFLARIAVPLFMIVSAFLLVPLKPGTTMCGFYKKRFKRIIPPMVFFLILYTFLPLLWGGMSFEQSLADAKLLPFNFPSMAGHLWFMYPLISIYLIMPIVSPWLERASAKDERIFIGLFALSTFAPWIRTFFTGQIWGECAWNRFSMLWYCSGYLGYLVLAHYIRVHLNWDERKKMRVGIICFLVGSIFTGWSFWWQGVPGQLVDTQLLEWSWEFCTPNILLSTFGAFLMFSCMKRRETPKLVLGLSKLSFGMYLVHIFYLSAFSQWIIQGDVINPLIPVWCAIPVIAICTFVASAVTIKLLSFIPGHKFLIG